VAGAALCALAGPAAHAQPLTECRVAGLRHSVQCGVLQRALDPARPDGPKIDIHYVVAPAMARRKLPDPVFLLAGGPGQSAITLAPSMLALFARLNNRRDIVFVDQRGTGKSAPLECADPQRESLAEQADPDRPFKRLMECRAALLKLPYIKAPGDLGYFTTTLAMQDLDAVRQAIGAERINLVGASYGTRAALEYARQFPQAVRRSVIDGVAPPDMVLPASFSTDGQAAFDKLLADCEREPACSKAFPTLRADWSALLADLPRTRTPWQQVLRTQLARALTPRLGISWSRPARSYIANQGRNHAGHRLPWEPGFTTARRVPRLVVVVDVSGSIEDAVLARFATEIDAITRRLEAGLTLVVGDDRVRAVTHCETGHSQLAELKFEGGGGTDFTPLLEEADRHRPDITVVLTDLEGPARFRPRWPVVWAVQRQHAAAVAPFGRLLVLD